MICPGIGLGSCLTVWYKEYLCILGFIAFPEDLYTPVIPVTRWTVPACLSYLHREGNLVSKRAICKIFGNVLLVCFVVFFLSLLDLKSREWLRMDSMWTLDLNDLSIREVWIQAGELGQEAQSSELMFILSSRAWGDLNTCIVWILSCSKQIIVRIYHQETAELEAAPLFTLRIASGFLFGS